MKADEEIEKFKSGDAEFIGQAMAKMNEMFAETDANSDGRLDRAESDVFFTKMEEWECSRGQYSGTYDTGYADNYNTINMVSQTMATLWQSSIKLGALS